MEEIKLQPLPLERQIAIFKLAKTEYKSIVKKYKDTSSSNIRGLCYVLDSILVRFNICSADMRNYNHIHLILPIFNKKDCIKLCRKHKYVLPDEYGFGYWYPRNKYQYRINLLNAIIRELTNQLNK